jgi:transposase
VALDEAGETILSRRFDHSREAFTRVFGESSPNRSASSSRRRTAGAGSPTCSPTLRIEAHMAHPLATRAIGAGRVKNDAVDAATLAHLLRTNLLPEAPIAPPEVRELRRLVRMRSSLVRIRSRLKCQVHALCADAGVRVRVSDLFGKKGRAQLETLALPPISASRLAACLRLVDELAREIIAADREIIAVFRDDDRVRRLLRIPGIGILTAATIVAEVGDVSRFPSADHLASWAGLTPTERSSADHVRRGHIS